MPDFRLIITSNKHKLNFKCININMLRTQTTNTGILTIKNQSRHEFLTLNEQMVNVF